MGREVIDVLARVDESEFNTLIELFRAEDRRWFFSGQGRSGLVATMAAMRWMHLGGKAHVIGEASAPSVRSADGVVFVSGSGETDVTLHFARVARSEGALVVAVTGAPRSSLVALAQANLILPVQRTAQLGGSLFEQAALLVLDAAILQIASGQLNADAMFRYLHTNMK